MGCLITRGTVVDPKKLLRWCHHQLFLDLDPRLHVVVVMVVVLLEVAALGEIAVLRAVCHQGVIVVTCLQNHKLLPLLIENGEVDLLIAE